MLQMRVQACATSHHWLRHKLITKRSQSCCTCKVRRCSPVSGTRMGMWHTQHFSCKHYPASAHVSQDQFLHMVGLMGSDWHAAVRQLPGLKQRSHRLRQQWSRFATSFTGATARTELTSRKHRLSCSWIRVQSNAWALQSHRIRSFVQSIVSACANLCTPEDSRLLRICHHRKSIVVVVLLSWTLQSWLSLVSNTSFIKLKLIADCVAIRSASVRACIKVKVVCRPCLRTWCNGCESVAWPADRSTL